MKTKIENTHPVKRAKVYVVGEIIMVFIPVLFFLLLMGSWVGDNPVRGFTIIWIANVLMLFLVLVSVKLRGDSLKEFGLTFPRINLRGVLKVFGLSLLVFVFGIFAYLLVPVIVASLTDIDLNADFSSYDYLKDNIAGFLLSLVGVYIVSSFGEEVIYRAFLINRISEIVSSTKFKNSIAIILSSVIFGLIHYKWGAVGMLQTGFMGLAMGISYVLLKKKLWVLVLAHAYMDTILLVQLYLASN